MRRKFVTEIGPSKKTEFEPEHMKTMQQMEANKKLVQQHNRNETGQLSRSALCHKTVNRLNQSRVEDHLGKKVYRYYTSDKLQEALNAVKNGLAYREAARIFKIPVATLWKHANYSYSLLPKTILTEADENDIVEWIKSSDKLGQTTTREIVCSNVQRMLNAQRRRTKFLNNKPGRRWYEGFRKRHPSLGCIPSSRQHKPVIYSDLMYDLIISQLLHDGFTNIAESLSSIVQSREACSPSDRLQQLLKYLDQNKGLSKPSDERTAPSLTKFIASQKSTASRLSASQKSTASRLSASQKSNVSGLSASQKCPASRLSASQKCPASRLSASQKCIVSELSASQKSTASGLSASQKSTASETSTASELSASQKSIASRLSASQKCTSSGLSASEKSTASELSASLKSTASELSASLKSTALELSASLKSTASELSASLKSIVSELSASQKCTASTVSASEKSTASGLSASQQSIIASRLSASHKCTASGLSASQKLTASTLSASHKCTASGLSASQQSIIASRLSASHKCTASGLSASQKSTASTLSASEKSTASKLSASHKLIASRLSASQNYATSNIVEESEPSLISNSLKRSHNSSAIVASSDPTRKTIKIHKVIPTHQKKVLVCSPMYNESDSLSQKICYTEPDDSTDRKTLCVAPKLTDDCSPRKIMCVAPKRVDDSSPLKPLCVTPKEIEKDCFVIVHSTQSSGSSKESQNADICASSDPTRETITKHKVIPTHQKRVTLSAPMDNSFHSLSQNNSLSKLDGSIHGHTSYITSKIDDKIKIVSVDPLQPSASLKGSENTCNVNEPTTAKRHTLHTFCCTHCTVQFKNIRDFVSHYHQHHKGSMITATQNSSSQK